MPGVGNGTCLAGLDSAAGRVLLASLLARSRQVPTDLLTFSKCLGRLASEVQSTYSTEHRWTQKYQLTPSTLTDACLRKIYICLH